MFADIVFDDPCREIYASPFLSVREHVKADRFTEREKERERETRRGSNKTVVKQTREKKSETVRDKGRVRNRE